MNLALLCLTMCTSLAHAIDEDTIFARHLEPITPIGGVLYVPLYSTQGGAEWPEQLMLQCSNGEVLTGFLGGLNQIHCRANGPQKATALGQLCKQIP